MMSQQHANSRPTGAGPQPAAAAVGSAMTERGARGGRRPDPQGESGGGPRATAARAPSGPAGAWRTLGRALRLRCPACGARRVRRTYFDFKPACPSCGLRLDRGEADYWIGGFMLNFVVGELIAVAAFLGAILVTWPDVPWRAVLYGSLVPAALGPALAYPFSRNLWLALDLLFRPAEPDDYAAPLA